MCRKSPAITYVYKKIRTTLKSVFISELKDYPLTESEFEFFAAILQGASIAELSEKFCKSPSRISQWKREVCEKIHAFDIANFMR